MLSLPSMHNAVRPSLHLDQQLRREAQHRKVRLLPFLSHPLPRTPRPCCLPLRTRTAALPVNSLRLLVQTTQSLRRASQRSHNNLLAGCEFRHITVCYTAAGPFCRPDQEFAEEQNHLRNL